MSFYDKCAVKNYIGLLETYIDYCWIALSNSKSVIVELDYGRNTYTRTQKMLYKQIITELNTSYNSPDKVVNYRLNRRRMFI